jgi:diguanylate cyclase (GGDEF)-like protein
MLGWHVGLPRLVQVHPSFPPMHYNTAVCFLLSGFAAMYAGSRSAVAGALSVGVIALGFVSLLQYVLDRPLGIDDLMGPAYVSVESSSTGRMAPQTAIGFMLAGSALATVSLVRVAPAGKVVAEILGSLLGGLGLAAVIGYCVGIAPAYGWAEFTRVALHTACGFVVLSFAILQNAHRSHLPLKSRWLQPMAIPVTVGALAVTLALHQALLTWEVERIDATTAQDVERATTALEARLHDYIQTFGTVAEGWGRGGGEPQPAWAADVARFLRDQRVFLAISRIGPTGKLDWIFPVDPYPDYVGFDYSTDARRSAWLTVARERGGPVLTEPLPLKSGKPGILIVAPLSRASSDGAPFVVAAGLVEEIFEPTATSMPSYRLAVFNEDRVVYGDEAEGGPRTMAGSEVRIDGASLRLAATPLPEAIAAIRSALPVVVLASGLLASFLLAVTAHLAQVASRRAAALSSANTRLKAAKKKLERLALFDELTGLGNRNLLLMELDKRLEVARQESASLPLLLIDLNGFKAINDTFGHDAGDDVLREFAARLAEAVALSDEAFRTGGDEFTVLAKPGTSLDEALAIAREIERITQVPLLVGGEQRVIRASIGIAAYPDHGRERARLLRAADVAMYQAKRSSSGIQVASDEAPTAVLRALQQTSLR